MFTFAHVIVFFLALIVIALVFEDDGNPPLL
jgi:hypothetical protein